MYFYDLDIWSTWFYLFTYTFLSQRTNNFFGYLWGKILLISINEDLMFCYSLSSVSVVVHQVLSVTGTFNLENFCSNLIVRVKMTKERKRQLKGVWSECVVMKRTSLLLWEIVAWEFGKERQDILVILLKWYVPTNLICLLIFIFIVRVATLMI